MAEVDTYREELATLRNATLVALTTGDRPLSIAKAAGLTGLSVPRARQLLGR